MARIRTIKPEIWMSPQVMNLSHSARLLFIGLITQADDEGRGTADIRRLKASIFGGDDCTSENVRRWLDECSTNDLVLVYETSSHGPIYALPTWSAHQKVDRGKKSTYPAENSPQVIDSTRIVERSSNARRTLDDESRGLPQGSYRTVPEGSLGSEGSEGSTPAASQPPLSDSEAVQRVFDHWRDVWKHPRAQLDEKRRKVIRAALKLYGEADLCQAITGYLNSPHHCGQNDRNTVFDSIETLLRDAKHIDAGLKFYSDPPSRHSKLTQRNIDNTSGWVPPEVRRSGQN